MLFETDDDEDNSEASAPDNMSRGEEEYSTDDDDDNEENNELSTNMVEGPPPPCLPDDDLDEFLPPPPMMNFDDENNGEEQGQEESSDDDDDEEDDDDQSSCSSGSDNDNGSLSGFVAPPFFAENVDNNSDDENADNNFNTKNVDDNFDADNLDHNFNAENVVTENVQDESADDEDVDETLVDENTNNTENVTNVQVEANIDETAKDEQLSDNVHTDNVARESLASEKFVGKTVSDEPMLRKTSPVPRSVTKNPLIVNALNEVLLKAQIPKRSEPSKSEIPNIHIQKTDNKASGAADSSASTPVISVPIPSPPDASERNLPLPSMDVEVNNNTIDGTLNSPKSHLGNKLRESGGVRVLPVVMKTEEKKKLQTNFTSRETKETTGEDDTATSAKNSSYIPKPDTKISSYIPKPLEKVSYKGNMSQDEKESSGKEQVMSGRSTPAAVDDSGFSTARSEDGGGYSSYSGRNTARNSFPDEIMFNALPAADAGGSGSLPGSPQLSEISRTRTYSSSSSDSSTLSDDDSGPKLNLRHMLLQHMKNVGTESDGDDDDHLSFHLNTTEPTRYDFKSIYIAFLPARSSLKINLDRFLVILDF